MSAQDYVVQEKSQQLLIEIEKKSLARSIVRALVKERKRRGLTQQDIADRTGMKAPNVTRIESCKFTPTLEVLERYAEAVGKKIQFDLIDVE